SYQEIYRVRHRLRALKLNLASQRDIFSQLSTESISWLKKNTRQHLANITARLTHYCTGLENNIMHITAIIEQSHMIMAEKLNERIYLMTLIALIFMPVMGLTSLFGVNLGGIPGSDSPWAFGLFILLLVMLMGLMIYILKKKRWF